MFRLIGTNQKVELWDQDFEIPIPLQNELLKLSNGMHLFAVGDTLLGWGYTVVEDEERSDLEDKSNLKVLENRYLDHKRVNPAPRRSSTREPVTYH